MSATEPLCRLFGVNPHQLTKEEYRLLEESLFISFCKELKEDFRIRYKDFFRLMNFSLKMENQMLEENYVSSIIKDILLSGEYTLSGIAYYTQTSEEIVYELVAGNNIRPTVDFFQRVIELHLEVRRDLYLTIVKKISSQFLASNLNDIS